MRRSLLLSFSLHVAVAFHSKIMRLIWSAPSFTWQNQPNRTKTRCELHIYLIFLGRMHFIFGNVNYKCKVFLIATNQPNTKYRSSNTQSECKMCKANAIFRFPLNACECDRCEFHDNNNITIANGFPPNQETLFAYTFRECARALAGATKMGYHSF